MSSILTGPLRALQRLRDRVSGMRPPDLFYSTYEHRLLAELDTGKLPQHVAVMADGNRRWARLNAPGQPLAAGYRAGADRLEEFVDWCAEAGIGLVTLWVLSTDNLRRADASELGPLLEVIAELVEELADNGHRRVQLVGALDLLPIEVRQRLQAAERRSSADAPIHVNIAISYGGRHELRDAFRSLLADQASKGVSTAELADTLEIEDIADHLYTAGQPDPDLVIRTSGEQRMSGFLIWQSVHSEFYFCEALWPDFRKVDFVRALRSYSQRERRFGR